MVDAGLCGFGELGRGHACREGDSETSWSRSSPTSLTRLRTHMRHQRRWNAMGKGRDGPNWA